MSDEKDYYKILGVSKDASRDDIKKAYKRLAKQYHPDLNKESSATDKFKEINEAASILGDDQKRQQYDQYGSQAFRGGGFNQGFDFSNFAQGFDFEDIFESFFGGGFGGSRRGRRSAQRGSDIRADLTIMLEQAAQGIKKSMKLRKRVPCSECEGAGGKDIQTCQTCQGRGAVRQTQRTPFGVFATTATCPSCNGQGQTPNKPCKTCEQTGVTTESVTLNINIPAGVEDGTRLRVPGEGDAGPNNNPSGDLYVFVTVEEHDYFKRVGPDLHLDVPISYAQAVLGDDIEVPTLFGKAKLKIPSGTQTATVFKLKGKGVPELRSHYTGDQLVTVTIDVPTKISKKEREALQAYANISAEHTKPQTSFFKKIFSS